MKVLWRYNLILFLCSSMIRPTNTVKRSFAGLEQHCQWLHGWGIASDGLHDCDILAAVKYTMGCRAAQLLSIEQWERGVSQQSCPFCVFLMGSYWCTVLWPFNVSAVFYQTIMLGSIVCYTGEYDIFPKHSRYNNTESSICQSLPFIMRHEWLILMRQNHTQPHSRVNKAAYRIW